MTTRDPPVNGRDETGLIQDEAGKSVGFAYLLWALFAVHRIYLGRPSTGFLQLFTLPVALVLVASDKWGGTAIGVAAPLCWTLWFVVDAFRIPRMVRECNSALAVRGPSPESGEAPGRQGATNRQ